MIRHELRMPHPTTSGRFLVWDLCEGRRYETNAADAVLESGVGPHISGGNVEGMGDTSVKVFGRETPRLPGRVRTGTRTEVRTAYLPLMMAALGDEWLQAQRLFWKCFSPDRPTVWRVTTDDGGWRELSVFLDPTDMPHSTDPTLLVQKFGIAFEADDPFWLGPEQVMTTAAQGSGQPFFGPDGEAPPFYIEPSAQGTNDAFELAGDETVWPILTVTGPANGFEVMQFNTGRRVSGGFNIPAGQKLVLDFDPSSQAAMLRPVGSPTGGTNVTRQLSERKFFAVENNYYGFDVVLLSMSGEGSARLTYRPRYRRAV